MDEEIKDEQSNMESLNQAAKVFVLALLDGKSTEISMEIEDFTHKGYNFGNFEVLVRRML